MKYIKTYEYKPWDYDIGSYVVVNPKYQDEEVREFFKHHVGKVTKMYYMNWYILKFDLPDDDIIRSYKISPSYLKKYLDRKDYNGSALEFISKNKEEAEEYIKIRQNINKYNI